MISYLSPKKDEYEKHSGTLKDPQRKILENVIQLKNLKININQKHHSLLSNV